MLSRCEERGGCGEGEGGGGGGGGGGGLRDGGVRVSGGGTVCSCVSVSVSDPIRV